MTTAIAISDIETIINQEPRVLDVKLGAALGMARPTNIRASIEANRSELIGFGPLHEQRAMVEIGSGARRPANEYYLNEAQALLLCMFARTSRAVEVRRQIIEVFMAWRRGEFDGPAETTESDIPCAELIQNVRKLRAGGMFTVRNIAVIHMISDKAVHILSDDCAPGARQLVVRTIKELHGTIGAKIGELEASLQA